MKEIKAPHFVPSNIRTVFLAGSIEMGTAEHWQWKVSQLLSQTSFTLVNPRRDDCDSSWVQSINDPKFREQVEWELQHITSAYRVLFYFDPDTKSPISLMELGIIAGNPQRAKDALVVCPDGFWRKGNVDVVCEWFGVRQYQTLETACTSLRALDETFWNNK